MFIQAIRVTQDSHSFFFFFSYYSQRKWNTDWSICKCGVCWDCWTAWLWIFLHGVLQVFVLGTHLFILVRWSLLKWAVLSQNKLQWAPGSFREEKKNSSMSKLMLTAKLPECPGARVNPLALCPDVYSFSCTLTLQGKLWSFQTDLLANGSLNVVCFRAHFSPAAPAICCFRSCSPFSSHYKIHHLKLEQYSNQKGNSITNSYIQNATQLELV